MRQPEEEMETVFDMEPSSTSSTPTSLVSQCLRPGGQVRRGGLEGWATPAALWRHQNVVPTLGIGEEMGPPRAPSTDRQDLAQVTLLPWSWLKSWEERRSKVFSTFPRRNSERKREVRENSATASSVV